MGFDDWQKSVGNECRFIDLDRRQATHSVGFADLATRRKTRLKLAEEMLWEARRRGVTPMYVLFDAKVVRVRVY